MNARMPARMNALLAWTRFAWLNTRRNRRRSLVTVAIAALGTAAILLAGGFALSTYQGLAEASARTTGHLVLAHAAQFDGFEDTPLQHGLTNAEALRQRLLSDPAVRQVLPRVEFGGLVSNGDKSVIMMGVGIEPDAEFAVKGPFLTVEAGRELAGTERGAVMLGAGLARNLKAQPGASLTLLASTTEGAMNALDVTVAGIVSTGVPEIDQRLVYTDVATAQRLLVTDRVSSLGIFLDRMEATLPARARLGAALPDLALRTWEEQAPFYRSVRALYNRIFGALGLIIGVIVVVVVANAMAMSVIERTREIGTLRALGTRPGQLLQTLAMEGLLLGAAGGAIGAAITVAMSVALQVFPVMMPPPPGRSTGYPLLITLDAGLMLATLGLVTTLVALASAGVARRTVRLPVVAALGHV
ncbi:ABC transporter permease [Sphaerotilus natans]|uniref:ABC transporter permease n=1 Tax=Sphaerotilus natans TaxID=34103 RepID=UPI00406C6B7D